MAVSKQITGMRGVYLVAAELSRLGFVVAPTSRGAKGTDLLVTDEEGTKAFTIQVKTKTGASEYWLVGEQTKTISSPSLVCVFVELDAEGLRAAFFVVPSQTLAHHVCDETFKGVASTVMGSWRSITPLAYSRMTCAPRHSLPLSFHRFESILRRVLVPTSCGLGQENSRE